MIHSLQIQVNPSKADTIGTMSFVHYIEVLTQRFSVPVKKIILGIISNFILSLILYWDNFKLHTNTLIK